MENGRWAFRDVPRQHRPLRQRGHRDERHTRLGAGPRWAGRAPLAPVDVKALLTKLAADKAQPSNWHQSIVDLLKLPDVDSSRSGRKELANGLNVHVTADGTAEEDISLLKARMQKRRERRQDSGQAQALTEMRCGTHVP